MFFKSDTESNPLNIRLALENLVALAPQLRTLFVTLALLAANKPTPSPPVPAVIAAAVSSEITAPAIKDTAGTTSYQNEKRILFV